MLKTPALSLAAVLVFSAATPTAKLTGKATDCFRRSTVNVSGVIVGAFSVNKNRTMVELLHSMDTATFSDADLTAMDRFGSQYTQLISLFNTSTALARSVSSGGGSFTLTIAPTDTVVVVGYEEMEDETYYYAYNTMAGRMNSSFILDMSRGSCPK
jgi:hypothetical protein